ncbi:uncharacterized protein LOC115766322 [Drosophila novamexicana]|uniref:uncharacterized protein LOC115766322 n=1 Tax=Drosophila novamexicana TaxID=47314 RepID=UPI0011E593DD|nr:uncharacterized protein LOC115766322 [Drosophila novamexicana]
MENLALRRGANASCNFNNMTDEQLQAWHTAVLSEAQRENYVNHNLEIVRHYRTEAISRAPAFDLERNAIDAAIARHGLCVPHAVASSESIARTQAAAAAALAATQEELQPPPIRRPRMEQPEEQQPNVTAAPSVSGTAAASATATGSRYGHYVALAHIFSDTYAASSTEATVAASGAVSANGDVSSTNNNNNSSTNKNQEPEEAEINDMAITKTIDSLGLRRT